jgi:hypothetical protein
MMSHKRNSLAQRGASEGRMSIHHPNKKSAFMRVRPIKRPALLAPVRSTGSNFGTSHGRGYRSTHAAHQRRLRHTEATSKAPHACKTVLARFDRHSHGACPSA